MARTFNLVENLDVKAQLLTSSFEQSHRRPPQLHPSLRRWQAVQPRTSAAPSSINYAIRHTVSIPVGLVTASSSALLRSVPRELQRLACVLLTNQALIVQDAVIRNVNALFLGDDHVPDSSHTLLTSIARTPPDFDFANWAILHRLKRAEEALNTLEGFNLEQLRQFGGVVFRDWAEMRARQWEDAGGSAVAGATKYGKTWLGKAKSMMVRLAVARKRSYVYALPVSPGSTMIATVAVDPFAAPLGQDGICANLYVLNYVLEQQVYAVRASTNLSTLNLVTIDPFGASLAQDSIRSTGQHGHDKADTRVEAIRASSSTSPLVLASVDPFGAPLAQDGVQSMAQRAQEARDDSVYVHQPSFSTSTFALATLDPLGAPLALDGISSLHHQTDAKKEAHVHSILASPSPSSIALVAVDAFATALACDGVGQLSAEGRHQIGINARVLSPAVLAGSTFVVTTVDPFGSPIGGDGFARRGQSAAAEKEPEVWGIAPSSETSTFTLAAIDGLATPLAQNGLSNSAASMRTSNSFTPLDPSSALVSTFQLAATDSLGSILAFPTVNRGGKKAHIKRQEKAERTVPICPGVSPQTGDGSNWALARLLIGVDPWGGCVGQTGTSAVSTDRNARRYFKKAQK